MKRRRFEHELPLSTQGERLIRLFEAVSTSYEFICKRKMRPSVKNMLEIMGSTVTTDDLNVMHRLDVFKLEIQPYSMSEVDAAFAPTPHPLPDLCLNFPEFPKPTKPDHNKRLNKFKKAVLNKMNETHNLFLRLQNLPQHETPPTAWHPNFHLEAVRIEPKEVHVDPQVEEGERQVRSIDGCGDYIKALKDCDWYENQIEFEKEIAPVEAEYIEFGDSVHPDMKLALEEKGIAKLFSHQREAIDAAANDRHVVLSTSTSSGKSVAFHVPSINCILDDPESTVLYLFPTKALAQDQLKSLKALLDTSSLRKYGIQPCTYDGDTPHKTRRLHIKHASIFLTNPDMLHVSVLPNHSQYRRILKNLKYVVVDEAHMYRGIFGSHVSFILSRLWRLALKYGSNPQAIACSATIANPLEHFNLLFPTTSNPRDVQVVSQDGSSSGKKLFALWNPNNSPFQEAGKLLAEMVQLGASTLLFCVSRKVTELVLKATHEHLKAHKREDLVPKVKSYRGGYPKELRRQIELDMFSGQLLGIVATCALELGIDIGTLDATIQLGFPSTISSLWQQAGRAGRSGKESVSIIIAHEAPLDQYFVRNPNYLFTMRPEGAVLDPENESVVRDQVKCAYIEEKFPFECPQVYERHGVVVPLNPVPTSAPKVNIRQIDPIQYNVMDQDTEEIIDTIPGNIAFFLIYPGAVYLYQGKQNLVTRLDLEKKQALVQPCDVQYYTKCRDFMDINPVSVYQRYEYGDGCLVHRGRVEVIKRIVGYYRKAKYTGAIIDRVDLSLPHIKAHGDAVWLTIDDNVAQSIRKAQGDDYSSRSIPAATHGINHVLQSVLPLFVLCTASDLMTEHPSPDQQRSRPAQILIAESIPGGIGLMKYIYPRFEEILRCVQEVIQQCPCAEGCPKCIHDAGCGEHNLLLDKSGAKIILAHVLKDLKN